MAKSFKLAGNLRHIRKAVETVTSGEEGLRRVALVALLYLIASVQALSPLDDPDMWWRFRTGQWIVEHRSVPMQDYFSSFAMGKPWIEYSWLADLLIYAAYALFDLPGVVYFIVAMALVVTFLAHRLVRSSGLPLVAEIAVVAAAVAAMKPLMTPRPWLFTIVLFAIELLIIDRVRRSGKSQLLWFLPPLFFLWANLHIQFVYGLAVVGLLLAEAVLVALFRRYAVRIEAPALSMRHLLLVFLACGGVTFLTPYHYVLYKQILEYIDQTSVFLNISELHPMFFRSADSWLVLMLTLATAFLLGSRRGWLPFPTLMFLAGTFLAFRARRDAWFLGLTAIWVIGDCSRILWPGRSFVFTKTQIAASTVAVGVTLFLLSYARGMSTSTLRAIVEEKFPVRAANFVNASRFPGPLFNDYDWGGFLLWSLQRLPVAIDGRLNLYGADRLERSLDTWDGRSGWESDPDLLRANLVIANKGRVLTSLLRYHPRFKVAYEDNIAVVFVAVR